MNKIFKLTALAMLSSAVLFSAASYAHMDKDEHSGRDSCAKHEHHDKRSHGEHRGFGKMKHALQHLDLSDAQRSEIKSIFAAAKPLMQLLHQAMQDSRKNLHSLMNSSDYDADAIKNAANNQGNLKARQLILMAQTKAEMFKVLSPDQQEQLSKKNGA